MRSVSIPSCSRCDQDRPHESSTVRSIPGQRRGHPEANPTCSPGVGLRCASRTVRSILAIAKAAVPRASHPAARKLTRDGSRLSVADAGCEGVSLGGSVLRGTRRSSASALRGSGSPPTTAKRSRNMAADEVNARQSGRSAWLQNCLVLPGPAACWRWQEIGSIARTSSAGRWNSASWSCCGEHEFKGLSDVRPIFAVQR